MEIVGDLLDKTMAYPNLLAILSYFNAAKHTMAASLISDLSFDTWVSLLDGDIAEQFGHIVKMELQPNSFTFYTSVSVMASSKIEGEKLELDSYVKHKLLNIEYLPELTEKPNDLYKAYLFAQNNPLTEANFLQAHKILSEHLLPEAQRGSLRTSEMLVLEHKTNGIQYEAALLKFVRKDYSQLWVEIEELVGRKLRVEEVFYYASYIHLVFVNIHPFSDGNGRAARLLEKWFLASHLGERAWFIPLKNIIT